MGNGRVFYSTNMGKGFQQKPLVFFAACKQCEGTEGKHGA